MSLGFGFGLHKHRFRGGVAINSNYQNVLDYANSEEDTLPASNIQIAQNKWFEAINPFFSKFTELHLWAGEAGLGGFKSIDLVRLNKADYYNSPSLLANGIKGNGTSSYVDLNFFADTESSVDNLSFGFFAPNGIDNTNRFQGVMGSVDAANRGILFLIDSEEEEFEISANSAANIFLKAASDELISVSNNGTNTIIRRNGTTLQSRSSTASFRSSNSVFLLARNYRYARNPLNFINDTISLSFIADELTASELGILSDATKTYLSEI